MRIDWEKECWFGTNKKRPQPVLATRLRKVARFPASSFTLQIDVDRGLTCQLLVKLADSAYHRNDATRQGSLFLPLEGKVAL